MATFVSPPPTYDNGVAAANGKTEQSVVATRLNLDIDLALTATERIHAFVRPLDKNGSFTRYQINGEVEDEFVDDSTSISTRSSSKATSAP